VLSRFDGTEWTPLPRRFGARGESNLEAAANVQVRGAPLRYQITLEPLRLSVIPLIEATVSAPQIDGYAVQARGDMTWEANRPIFERVRFEAVAYERFRHGPVRATEALAADLALPPGYNPRTLEWAARFARAGGFDAAEPGPIVRALLEHIRTGRYTYTLAAESYGRDAVDEFWLDRREGFCEHFAAAFVVVLRALGVPARVVTGYQGAEPVPIDGYYVVRQSSAHAWAEYWQRGVGWVRADPTAAVAPDRIIRSLRLAPQTGFVAGALGSVNPALLAELRAAWETLNNRWNQWVLNYSRGQQFDVLRSLGFSAPAWEDLALLLIGALSTLALGGAVWAWWDRRRVDPWTRQMEQLRRCLAALGVPARAHEPPRTLAARLRTALGGAGEPLAALLDGLDRQRYAAAGASHPDPTLTRRFRAETRRLRAAASG
jgi:transglutaminase-like putative cysteine protease